MKKIAIQDMNGRSAAVLYSVAKSKYPKQTSEKKIRCIKSTPETEFSHLFAQRQKDGMDAEQIALELVKTDPEIDFEKVGMKVGTLHKFYADENSNPCRNVHFLETILAKDGSVKVSRPFHKKGSSVCDEENPLKWSGKYIPYKKAAESFVISKVLQLQHTSSLEFDFLFNIATDLNEHNSVMYVGSGEDGSGPVILQTGGKAFRAFLIGRTSTFDKKRNYRLALLLSEMEYKDI